MNIYKIFKIIFINILFFIFLIIVIELILGNKIYKKKLKCEYLLCSVNLTYKNDLYSGTKNINYIKDRYGFRGLRKNVNEIDILTVGGSTTDERYLQTEDTWSEKLEKKINNNYKNLDIDIVNAGIDGQSTKGHIWNFENWFFKINNFKTKYIFFYIGINETFSKEFKTSNKIETNIPFSKKIKTWIKDNNGLVYKFYNLFYKKYLAKDILNVGHKIRKPNYKLINNFYYITENDIKEFDYRLDKLVYLSKSINAIPIFITQKTLRHKIKNNQIYSINDTNYYYKEKLISEIIMRNCKKNDIFCIDLFNKIEFTKDDLYDLVHASPKGANTIANNIFDEITLIINDF